jgi:hypothetical protein
MLHNIIERVEGVHITRRNKLGGMFKFLTKPLNEGDNKGGLVMGLPKVLELNADEVRTILEIIEVFCALHRQVHGMIEECRAKPREREKSSKETINGTSTTVGVITRHEAEELCRGMIIQNYLYKYRQHTWMVLSRASRGCRLKISQPVLVTNLRFKLKPPNQKGSWVFGILEREVFRISQPKKGRDGWDIRRPRVSRYFSIITNLTRRGTHRVSKGKANNMKQSSQCD